MSMIKTAVEKMKSMYVPVKDTKVRITMDGIIACPSNGEYRAFVNGELTNIPEQLLLPVPMYRISKPISEIVPGDVIKTYESKTMKSGIVDPEGKYTYRLVLEIKDGNIKTVSYGGANSTIKPVKDFFLGQKTASVVVNMFNGMGFGSQPQMGGFNPMMLALLNKEGDTSDLLPLMMMQSGGMGGMNPMMLALLNKDGDTSDLLPFMMMQQGGGTFNPMMLALLSKDGNTDFSDFAMIALMQQNGGMSNIFGTPATVTAEVTTPTAEAPASNA